MEGERFTTLQLSSRTSGGLPFGSFALFRAAIIVFATVVAGMAVYAARPKRQSAPVGRSEREYPRRHRQSARLSSAQEMDVDHASGTEDRFEIASSVYRLQQSACFLKSAGRMRCTTCHDTHKTEMKNYNSVCRQCHAAVSDARVASEPHNLSADYVSRHMPKRRTDDVVLVVMTDHKIQRKVSGRDLIAEMPERLDTKEHAEIVAYDPKLSPSAEDQLYLAIAHVWELGKTNSGIPRLSKLIDQYRPKRAD